MPGYQNGQATLLRTNQQKFLLNNETVAAGGASIAVQLDRISNSFYPWGFSVQVKFGAAPGAFEIDVQVADTDNNTDYISVAQIQSANASNVGRVDVTTFFPRFVRVIVVTLTNAVGVTALITR